MGMDLDKVAGVVPAVDVAAVEEELRRYLAGEPDDRREPWTIETVGQADWAMEQIGEALRRSQAYQDEVDLWASAKKRLNAGVDWLQARLEEWALAQRTDKAKSFPLAHGTVSTAARKPGIDIADETAAIEWARANAPDAIHTDVRLNKSEIPASAARVAEVIVAYESIVKSTGEMETVLLPEPRIFDGPKLDRLRARLGDDYEVRPVFGLAVLDDADRPVPGLAVRPASITASIKPLWQ